MEKKKELRARVLARRDALSVNERAHKSALICDQLERLLAETLRDNKAVEAPCSHENASARATECACSLTGAKTSQPLIAVYAAMRSEVSLQPFVEAAFSRGWGVCFPCMVRDEADEMPHMAFYRVSREQMNAARAAFLDAPLRCLPCATLGAGGYQAVGPSEIDVVLVPLVAFDDEGNRLGYGGGNYDRLLPHLRSDTVVFGVAFNEQREPALPCEPHDQPLARIISA